MPTDQPETRLRERLSLFAYGAAASALRPLVPRHLQKRVRQGKEDPHRWGEKLGRQSVARPEGPLVWLHAVGLGETMALRGIIAGIHLRWPAARFLATSTTLASARLFEQNLPPRTIHQFLPLDVPAYVRRFLDHWQPDISIWTEQDLWPTFIDAVSRRDIPLALINARISPESAHRRGRFPAIFRAMMGSFNVIYAQNRETAEFLRRFRADKVGVVGAVKSLGPALAASEADLVHLRSLTEGKFIWVGASTHAADEEVLIAAQLALRQHLPDAILVIVPRDPQRGPSVVDRAKDAGLVSADTFASSEGIFVDSRFGTLGLWYRLADAAFIGGTMDEVEGHNPWEAIAVGCPVLHGPRVRNFDIDFRTLVDARAAHLCTSAEEVVTALLDREALTDLAQAGTMCREKQQRNFDKMFDDIVRLAE